MNYDVIKKNLAIAYDKQSSFRNESKTQDWKLKERDIFLSYLVKENKRSLLEIGAGPGKDSLFFKEKGLQTLTTDISPESVSLCKEKGLDAKVLSFDKMDLESNHFEAIWALNCLLHIPKKELPNVLREIKRVLTHDGLFYMGVYGGEDSEGIWEDDFHDPKRFFSFFKDEELKELLAQQFKVEYFQTIPNNIVGGVFDFQSIILRKE